MRLTLALACACACAWAAAALGVMSSVHAAESAPLVLESRINLGEVRGRLDHLTIDRRRQRLFAAELGNDSIGVVDLISAKLLRTLRGFRQPQGIAFVAGTDALYVANGGDGSVRILRGADFATIAVIALRSDADNVRVDEAGSRVYVGHGSGALAVIDPLAMRWIADIPLRSHPESFRVETRGPHILVNVPGAAEIAVVASSQARQVASWSTPGLSGNFALILDEARQQALVAFRRPAVLAVLSLRDGRLIQRLETCEDADDVFVDAARQRVYVSCGAGFIDAFVRKGSDYQPVGRVPTLAGARTALFDPDHDRLYVAVPATGALPAAIWVYRPAP